MAKVIRASSLPTYQDCQRKFAAGAIPDLIEAAGYARPVSRTSYAAEIGTAVHAVLAKMLEEKRDIGTVNPGVPDTTEIIAEFEAAVTGVEPDDTTPGLKAARKQIEVMSRMFGWAVLPLVNPLYIEQAFSADLGDGIELSGHVDLIETNGLISDHKTSTKKKPNAFHSQMGAYSILARTNLPDLETRDTVRINAIQRVKVGFTQPDPVLVEYDRRDCEDVAWSVLDEAKEKILKFEANGDISLFLPNPASNLCSKVYCPVWGTNACTYGKE